MMIIKLWFIQIGWNKAIFGICIFDKYMISNKGFEILKT